MQVDAARKALAKSFELRGEREPRRRELEPARRSPGSEGLLCSSGRQTVRDREQRVVAYPGR